MTTTYALEKQALQILEWLQKATDHSKRSLRPRTAKVVGRVLEGIHVTQKGSESADGFRLHMVNGFWLHVSNDDALAIDEGTHVLNDGKPFKKRQNEIESVKLDDRDYPYPNVAAVIPTEEPAFAFTVNSQFLIDAASMPASGGNDLKEGGTIITLELYQYQSGATPRLMIKTPDGKNQALVMPIYAPLPVDKGSKVAKLPVTEYELFYDEESQRSVTLAQIRGTGCVVRWAIKQGSECLNKVPVRGGYYMFSTEPLPSSRDDDYYQDHRFATADEAYDFWMAKRRKILVTKTDWEAFVRAGEV